MSENVAYKLQQKLLEQLNDEVDEERLPAYVKVKLLGYLDKLDDGSREPEEGEEAEDLLDIILDTPLPIEKKREMLAQELDVWIERRDKILGLLKELDAREEQEAAEVPLHEVR